MIGSFFLFAVSDASAKWLVVRMPVWQVLSVRSAVVAIVCVGVGGRGLARRAFRSPVRNSLLLRGGILFVAWALYFSASRTLGLAQLVTLYYFSPIVVVLLAGPCLGERTTPFRLLIILGGFAGVVIASQPNEFPTLLPAVMALTAAVLCAISMIIYRKIVAHELTTVQVFATNLTLVVAGAMMLPFTWHTPTRGEWGVLAMLGAVGAGAQLLLMEGIRRSPASVAAPLEFSALVWAFAFGYLIWDDIPHPAVFVGAAILTVSGAAIVWSEWTA